MCVCVLSGQICTMNNELYIFMIFLSQQIMENYWTNNNGILLLVEMFLSLTIFNVIGAFTDKEELYALRRQK